MEYAEAHNFIYNEIGDEGFILLLLLADDKIQEGLQLIKKLTSCDDNTAKLIWCDLKVDYGSKENNSVLQARENYENEKALQDYQYSNNAECPYCHSKNTKKISGLSKAGSVVLWGVFALGKTTKQWHCNNCKSDF